MGLEEVHRVLGIDENEARMPGLDFPFIHDGKGNFAGFSGRIHEHHANKSTIYGFGFRWNAGWLSLFTD